MAIDYARMSALALRLITTNGRPVVLVRINRAPADPALPWRGSVALPDGNINATAAFVEPTSDLELGRRETRGPDDSLKRGYEIAFIAAEENPLEDLTEYDRIIDNGQVFKMDKIHVLQPGATRLLYTVEVER